MSENDNFSNDNISKLYEAKALSELDDELLAVLFSDFFDSIEL